MSFYKVTKKKLKECAELQPLDYFEKYLDILIHNLRMELKRYNHEANRPDYEVTAQLVSRVYVEPVLKQVFFLLDIVRTKKQMIT